MARPAGTCQPQTKVSNGRLGADLGAAPAFPPSIGPHKGTFVAFPRLMITATLREPCLHQLKNFQGFKASKAYGRS
jgi:hypothetical protein